MEKYFKEIRRRSSAFILLASLFLPAIALADTDVTLNVEVEKSRLVYDRRARTSSLDISLKNISENNLSPTVRAVVENTSDASVRVTNADGATQDGKPYFDYAALLPGAVSDSKNWVFSNPQRLRFTYTVSVFLVSTDSDPPTALITNPPNNAVITNNSPLITIEYHDDISEIDTDSFQASINGNDATALFNVTESNASYQLTSSLAEGTHVISASISDTQGNTAAVESNFTVGVSSEPLRYIFSLADNDWVFASPGDGTCMSYLNRSALGLNDYSDITALTQILPNDDFYFGLAGKSLIYSSPADGSNTIFHTNTDMGAESSAQVSSFHIDLSGNGFLNLDAQPYILKSPFDGTSSLFIDASQLGIVDSDTIECLHIGYDGTTYFCSTDGDAILESLGSMSSNIYITADDLGVPGSIINAFAILPDATPPSMEIESPLDGSIIETRTPIILISYSDSESGIDTNSLNVQINGVDSSALFDIISTDAGYSVNSPLPIGDNVIVAQISDKTGNTTTITSEFSIDVFEASINATPTLGGIPLEVQFSADIVGGTPPYTYDWDIDGDSVSDDSRASFSHIYQTKGVYSVTLIVNDNSGESATDNISISALSAPTVVASANPTTGPSPLEVTLSATVSDSDGNIALYEWDYTGDGTYDYLSSSSPTTNFTYSSPGLYHATIRATDNEGLTGTSSVDITVGASPSASASATPVTGQVPLDITFSGSGSDSDGTIALYEWDFNGDGIYDWSSTTNEDATYTFNSSGVFNSIFRVTDNDGLIDTDSVSISVAGPPISKPGGFPTSGQAPLTVTFFSDGEDLDGSPEYYDWDFNGDGTRDTRLIASMNTSYTYSQAGTYQAALTVIDNEGLSDTEYITITVTAPSTATNEPTAVAIMSSTNGGAPLSVFFSGKGTDEDGTIAKIEWDFEGDGVFDFQDTVVDGSTLGNILDVGSYSNVTIADIDGDGDLDMLIGERYGQVWFCRNDGTNSAPVLTPVGYLTDSSGNTIDVGSYSSPDFVDIDNDGDFDLLIGEYYGRIIFYRNDGNSAAPIWTSMGYLTDSLESTIDVGSRSCPDFVDIDGDGDLDLITGESGGTIRIYLNTGSSTSPAWMAADSLSDSDSSTIDAGSYSSPNFVDIDADGDEDLLVGESGGRIQIYLNTGTSTEPSWTSAGYLTDSSDSTIDVGSYSNPDFVDIDNDGDLDFVTGESNGRIRYYYNTGDPQNSAFQSPVSYLGYVGTNSYSTPCIVDFDRDGDFDMFLGDNYGQVFYYRNDGSNSEPFFNPIEVLTDTSSSIIDVGSRSKPALVDIDNDGDFDLLIGEYYGRIVFYRNDGTSTSPIWTSTGYLIDSSNSTIDVGSYSYPDFVDIDADGDLDMLIGESGGRIRIYLNDVGSGTPVWTSAGYAVNSSGSTIDVGSYSYPDFSDLDKDGDLDMLIGERNGQIVVYRNQGNTAAPVWVNDGYFSDSSGSTIDVGSYSSPEFVDMDNDGDADLISGNSSGYVYLYPTVGSVNHIYSTPGTYEATLRVTDSDSNTGTASVTITVLETGAPTAKADASPVTGDLPLNVSFDGQGIDNDGSIISYEWDFDGDGTYDWSSTDSGETTYTYNQVGNFSAILRVTDNDGKTSTDSIGISTRLTLSAARTEMFDPASGETGSITTTITGDTVMTVEIIDRDGNVVQTLIDSQSRTSGTYTDIWNGKDAKGNIVRDGVYYFLVEHTENGETQIFDLRETAQYREVTPSRSWPSTFNPYEEDYVKVTYSISYPAEVSMYFWRRDYSRPESSIAPVRTMFLRQPKVAGTYTEIWDGVDDEGKVVEPWSGGYCITLWTYELPSNAMIVTGNTPVITNIEADSNYFNPAYNPYAQNTSEYTSVSFELSESASLVVEIKNTDGVVVKKFTKTNLPSGKNMIIWNGKDFDDNLVKNGSYSISLTAIDDDGNQSLSRYAAVVVHY